MAKKYEGTYTLKDKQAAIRDALRRMEPVHVHWRMLESLYRTGAQRELTMLDLNRIMPFPVPGSFLRTVNMVLPHLTMIINSVVQRDPKFVVTPMGGDISVIERNAKIANEVLDYFWKRTDATATIRDMTQDMVILGNGFGKTGWSYSEATVDRTSESTMMEATDLISEAQEMALESGVPLDETAMQQIVDSVAITQQLVELDEPYLEYVSPFDLFLPANSRRINNSRWVCQRLRVPLEEIRENPNFNKQAVADIKSDTAYTDPSTYQNYEQQEEALPEAFTHATVYEFYDMKSRTLCVFQMDSAEALYEGPIPYDHRYPPFVHMRNFSDGGSSIWAFGDLENIAGVQLMINEIMHAELNDLKRVGNKYFINRKVMTPELTKALMDNKPDSVIPIDLPNNVNLNEVIQPVQRLATPADNYVMEGKLQDYMQRILGITDFQLGNISAANRVPGTAAAAVEGAATVRALEKLTNVEKAAREVAIRMLALCQQFLDNTRAIRIAGAEAPLWLQVNDTDIEGEFSIEVEGGSTSAINPATRARQGFEMLQVIIPALTGLGYNPEPALRTALSYIGINPDNVLVKAEVPQMPESVPNSPTGPLNGMPQPSEAPDILGQLQELGATPMPETQEGGLL
jgi:hypothetical protein